MTLTRKIILFFSVLLWLASCSKRNYNVDAESLVDQPQGERPRGFLKKRGEPLALTVDTAAQDQQQQKNKKRKIKKSKKEFLGYRIKRGFTKTGSSKNAVI